MDFWNVGIPIPVALAIVAALGYWIGRRNRTVGSDLVLRSRRDLKRARAVASELEKIAWTVRQSLARHHASVSRFKDRVYRLSDQQQDRLSVRTAFQGTVRPFPAVPELS